MIAFLVLLGFNHCLNILVNKKTAVMAVFWKRKQASRGRSLWGEENEIFIWGQDRPSSSI
jgi:hypothetical protein